MIKKLLRTLLLLAIFFLGLLTFLLFTPSGLDTSIRIIGFLSPGKLKVEKISGMIIGPLSLNNIVYHDKQQTLQIKNITLNWQPLYLLTHTLKIKKLVINNVELINHTDQKNWNLTEIKTILQTTLNDFEKYEQNTQLSIDQADINNVRIQNKTTHDPHKIYLKKIDFQGDLQHQKIDFKLNITTEKPVLLSLHFSALGTPALYNMTATVDGARTHWVLNGTSDNDRLSLSTSHTLFLNGLLDIQSVFDFTHTPTWESNIIGDWPKTLSVNIRSTGQHDTQWKTNTTALLKTDKGKLNLTLNSDDQWHIHWLFHTDALSRWLESVEGNLSSEGSIEGDLDNPAIKASVTSEFETENLRKNHLNLSIDGTVKQHQLHATLTAIEENIMLHLQGGYADDAWSGLLTKFSLSLAKNTLWDLQKPAKFKLSDHMASLDPLCLLSQKAGTICINGQSTSEKIMGKIQIHLSHFGWLESFMPSLHIAPGTMEGNLAVTGTPKNPDVHGELHFIDSKFVFTHLGITLDNLTAKISKKANALLLDIHALSGNQPITLTGDVDLSKKELSAKGVFKTNNLLFINTDEYSAYATADITAMVTGQNVLLKGDILIPKADIHPNDFRPTVSLPDHDIVYVGELTHPPKPFWTLQTDLTIKLGDNVSLNAAGANAQLGGTLHISQLNTAHELLGNGAILVSQGTYAIYGKTLKIAPNSSLSFTNSPLNNPHLSIKATKTIETLGDPGISQFSNFSRSDLVVGIALTGTAKEPKFSFFSNQANLSETDILSYIVLGYASNNNTPGNTDLLMRALSAADITSQSLTGKENLSTKLQKGLGLRELGVESETTVDALGNSLGQQSAFVVGKNITQKIYVRYGLGIPDPVNVIQVRYLIDKNWAVQANSSTLGSGGDVLYTIEKD